MTICFEPISYRALNGRQKEAYNFQRVSAVLADYGFVTIRMTSDWGGADFIAQHKDGKFFKVQLKSRLTFEEAYRKKELYICFEGSEGWYLYPHDTLLDLNIERKCIGKAFWMSHEKYSNPTPSVVQREWLDPYLIRPGQILSL